MENVFPSRGAFSVRPDATEAQGMFEPEYPSCGHLGIDPHIEEMRQRRWSLAAKAIDDFPSVRDCLTLAQSGAASKMAEAQRLYPEIPGRFKMELPLHCIGQELTECPSEEFVTDIARNWPGDDLLRQTAGLKMGIILWFASMGFGAVHIAAWRGHFPTEVEAKLWRLSSVYIASSGLLWASINLLALVSKTFWWFWYDLLVGDKHWTVYAVVGFCCVIGGTGYIFARVFLVVEVFVSLRSVPVGAYIVPQWTLSLPHL